MKIPAPLDADFCLAASNDIRSWSFGAVTRPRQAAATDGDNVAGTLHDQRIFGPIRDFACACGKFTGARHENMICDRCGVKVAPKAVRGSRFGHIEFPGPIPHPFAPHSELLCFPVLPMRFNESPGGYRLPALYDQLVEEAGQQAVSSLPQTITAIVEQLIPVAIVAHNWRLAAARTLARGLALKDQDAGATARA